MRSKLFVSVMLPAAALWAIGCGDSPGNDHGSGDMSTGTGGGGHDMGGGGGSDGGGTTDAGNPDSPPDLSLPGPTLPDLVRYVNPMIGTAAAPNVENPVGGGKGGSD